MTPTVDGSMATYSGLWPATDLTEQVNSSEVEESLVLSGPSAPASYVFDVSGATVHQAGRGAEVVAGGSVIGQIPAPTIRVAGRRAGNAGVVSGVALTATGNTITVAVSPTWLAGLPGSAFPVVIDPTFSPTTLPTASAVKSFTSSNASSASAQIGVDGSGNYWAATADIPLPSPPAPAAGQRPWVMDQAFFNALCGVSGGCAISNEFIYGEPNQPSTYQSIGAGSLIYQQNNSQGLAGVFLANITSVASQVRCN